jgi:hypothetical protein
MVMIAVAAGSASAGDSGTDRTSGPIGPPSA